MTIILPTLAAAFAGFCVWLTVRVINRRERWAKRVAVAMVALPLLYVLSFGPVCWMTAPSEFRDRRAVFVPQIYFPIGLAASQSNVLYGVISWFAYAGRSDGTHPRLLHRRAVDVGVPTCWDGAEGIRL